MAQQRSNKSKSGKQKKSDSKGHITVDHEEIRRWVEERGGRPATVSSTKEHDEPGLLRIDFPSYSGEQSLEEITWEEFFEVFEDRQLAFLYQDETADGKQSRFSKLISREGETDVVEEEEGGEEE